MKKVFTIICLLLMLTGLNLYAQESISFWQGKLSNYKKQDTTRVSLLLNICKEYTKNDNSLQANIYADSAVALATKLKSNIKLADAYEAKGSNYRRDNDPNAVEFLKKAVDLEKTFVPQRPMGTLLMKLALAYHHASNYPMSLETYFEAMKVLEKSNDKPNLGLLYSNLARLYNRIGNINKAYEMNLKAAEIGKEINDSVIIANAYQGLAIYSYKNLKDYPKAHQYLSTALKIFESEKDYRSMASVISTTANTYDAEKKHALAIEYLTKSAQICEEHKYKIDLSSRLLDLSTSYQKAPDNVLKQMGVDPSKRNNKIFELINKAYEITKEVKQLQWQSFALRRISGAYEQIKDYEHAYQAYKNYTILKDSIMNDQTSKELLKRELQYDFDKKEASIKLEQAITAAKLQQQQLLNTQQKQQLLFRQQELSLATKEKDLQHLAWLKTQAELKNYGLIQKQNQEQLKLSEKNKQLQKAKLTTLIQENELNQIRIKQMLAYGMIFFVIIAGVISYFFNRARIKQLQLEAALTEEKNEKRLKEVEFQHKMNDATLSALRSQMNPHFLFNCLNSIKLYSMENDSQSASAYLTKFSRLIRLVLENSRSKKITLANELETLRLYIEMEAMRFKEKVQYEINLDSNIDDHYVEIPPLLIQPYVENAIWHGLMHKEKGGMIQIDVKQPTEQKLHVEITDNGVGREKAKEYKSKSAASSKSFGMKITNERIELINQMYDVQTEVEIIDLKDQWGNAIGTKVVLDIPV